LMPNRSRYFFSCLRIAMARRSALWLMRWLPHHDLSFWPNLTNALYAARSQLRLGVRVCARWPTDHSGA
jgi:hypothetical protein